MSKKIFIAIYGLFNTVTSFIIIPCSWILGFVECYEMIEYYLRHNTWKTESILQSLSDVGWLSDVDRNMLASEWKGLYAILEGIPNFIVFWLICLICILLLIIYLPLRAKYYREQKE